MRTKTLLITAALTAAGALTSMAQVYSVNVVGYVNLNIPAGFSLVANQLDNTPDNTIATLFPSPPNGTTIYKYATVGGFGSESFNGAWSASGVTTMNPGEGVFILAPTAFPVTFVGQVKVGATDINNGAGIPGGFSIVSSMFPQAGYLYDPAPDPGTSDLGFGVPVANEVIYQYHTVGGYGSAQWTGAWSSGTHGPSLAVGEAFFNLSDASQPNHHWVRSFDVGTGFH